MEILGSLHHFIEYETPHISSASVDASLVGDSRSESMSQCAPKMIGAKTIGPVTLFTLMTLVAISGLQQTLIAAVMTQFTPLSLGSLKVHAATVSEVPIGDLVEAMVGENSDMADVVEEAEQVEVKINLQKHEGETYVSVEGRYDEDADEIPSAVVTSAVTTSSTVVSSNGLLKYGVRGPQVVLLQDQLKALGYFSATSTGYFGELTEAAVIKFQYANGLAVDGVAGPQTLGWLTQAGNTQYAIRTTNTPTEVQYVVASTPRTTVIPNPPGNTVIRTNMAPAQVVSYSAVTSTPQSNPPVAAANPATSIDGAKVGTELYIGSQGQLVRDIQTLLKQSGRYSGPVTGYFGPLTAVAIENFQSSRGLAPTGIVGEKTLVELYEASN